MCFVRRESKKGIITVTEGVGVSGEILQLVLSQIIMTFGLCLLFQQLRSIQRCITPVSSLSPILHRYVSWSWRISRYVTSYGVNRCADFFFKYKLLLLLNPSININFSDLLCLMCAHVLFTDSWKHLSAAEEVEAHTVLSFSCKSGRIHQSQDEHGLC